MTESDIDLTAYCGLYCGDCIRYKCKASDLALALSDELDRISMDNYAEVKSSHVKEFGKYKDMRAVLDVIMSLKCRVPCRLGGDGCRDICEIKRCVISKKIEGCWECNEFEECDKFEFLKPFHGDAPKTNLRKIKKYGLDKWCSHREKCYPWLIKK